MQPYRSNQRRLLKIIFCLFRYNYRCQPRRLIKYLQQQKLTPRQYAWTLLNKHKFKRSALTHLQLRCSQTGRTRGINRISMTQRLTTRNTIANVYLPGIIVHRW